MNNLIDRTRARKLKETGKHYENIHYEGEEEVDNNLNGDYIDYRHGIFGRML
jgi:hypothetical protein